MIMCHDIFNVWPETTLLLPVRLRDARRLDMASQSLAVTARLCYKPHNLFMYLEIFLYHTSIPQMDRSMVSDS